jgi:hypothetical protein
MKQMNFKSVILIILVLNTCNYKLFAQSRAPQPIIGDDKGFESIFDGKSLTGWEGDSERWRAENGKIVGETTPEKKLKRNTFLIWRGGTTGDFELKLEYKISAKGNSGIQYRSYEVDGAPFGLKGYQFDIDGQRTFTGLNYEEGGRQFLASRGQICKVARDEKPIEIGSVGEADELKEFIKQEDWNECHLIVRGNTLVQIINGHLMSMVVDDDVDNRKMEGLLGLQIHGGPPMKIEYRNIRLKKY